MSGKANKVNVSGLSAVFLCLACTLTSTAYAQLDLAPLPAQSWGEEEAKHLGSRAGFGLSQRELERLSRSSPDQAVKLLLQGFGSEVLPDFDHSGVFEPALDPFPPSRPATTRLAKQQGHALGVKVKPSGNRPLQPVVNKFFYWLRASRLETDRVSYWWADRMLNTRHPLREKLALFWHGHFATNEDKVRDYRKMLLQLELFQDQGLGNFRDLLIAVAQDPAMLTFLDAGVNTNDSPNENFAREIMELFTMGVGHYTERDVQEAARAFTGWNVSNLDFTVIETLHDDGEKTFLGQTGNFSGVDVIDLVLAQQATADFLAAKLYRYFVSEDLADEDVRQLGELLVAQEFRVADFLGVLFRSRDFYALQHRGARIKSPVEMMVFTYRQLGLDKVPGVPDFNVVSGALGQRLLHPPTVAGWSQGRSWITPSLMFERSNFVLDVLFPSIDFVPPDRNPPFVREVSRVQARLRQGLSIANATKPTGMGEGDMAASNMLADRDEDFNTRLGSMRGWQMALERVKPIPRTVTSLNLSAYVLAQELSTPREVVDHLARKFFHVRLSEATLGGMSSFLIEELGTEDMASVRSYAEEPLRKLLHKMLSLPEYQLG